METETISQNILEEIYKPRDKDTHKGDYGYVLIVGGSSCYSGAPALAAMAAYRAGSDLVTICAPKRAADIAAGFSPSIITCPLKGEKLSPKNAKIILDTSQKYDALLLGNGAGSDPETIELFKMLIKETNLPLVIDADALRAVDKNSLAGKKTIITPHAKEFQNLTGIDLKGAGQEKKITQVKKTAQKLQTVIILKGPEDIISDGQRVTVNRTGSAYMSVGGTGDILAGICVSLLARNIKTFKAASAGAYLCGKAGERAAKRFEHSLIAEEVIKAIPEIL